MPKRNPEIMNLIIEEANQEYSIKIPSGIKEYTLKARMNNDIRFAYKEGESDNVFLTLPGKSSKTVSDLSGELHTIYFRSAVKGEVLEIECWS